MIQTADEITDKLTGAVKADKSFYTLKDLITAGYPNVIAEGMRVAINQQIARELKISSSPWINWQNQLVEESWEEFIQSAKSSSVIPNASIYELTRDVVLNTLQIYVQPRQNLANFIYGEREELDYSEMMQCLGNLTVHKHFGRAIPLYMQKRKLQSLEKNRCALLIQKLDANLTSSYGIDDWLESLDVLFVLFNGKADTHLISLFFEDKGYEIAANAFKNLKGRITKEQFRSVLEELEWNNPEELAQKAVQESTVSANTGFNIDKVEHNLMETFSENYSNDEAEDEGSLNALFKEQSEKTIFNNFEEEAHQNIKNEKTGREEAGLFHENLTSVLDMAANSFKHLSKVEAKDDDAQKDEISGKDEKETPIHKKPEESRIIPKEESEATHAEESDEPVIWQQFISEEQRETLLWTSNEDEEEDENAVFLEEEELIEDNIIEEQPPFANVDYKKEAPAKQDEDLRVYLMGQEVYLIEEVFGGSEKKYQKALDKIVQFQDWEKAAGFIQDEVFMKNKIDMYSEAAIEFIDQLQSYFKEFKN